MKDSEINHLIKMLNQIAANLARGEDDETDIAKVADHLQRFWSPGMRTELANYVEQNPEALPRVCELAILKVKPTTTSG